MLTAVVFNCRFSRCLILPSDIIC
uniref:Uncharacterized protein n=1 Tax=Rhizophora mucronata TaxID=61149 RepID=A0A2P2LUI8_RHIMU